MLFTSNVFLLINYFSQILWLSVVASIAALLWLRVSKLVFQSIQKKTVSLKKTSSFFFIHKQTWLAAADSRQHNHSNNLYYIVRHFSAAAEL